MCIRPHAEGKKTSQGTNHESGAPHSGKVGVPDKRGHIGLSLNVRATPKRMMAPTFILPKPLAHPRLPDKARGPIEQTNPGKSSGRTRAGEHVLGVGGAERPHDRPWTTTPYTQAFSRA